MLYFGDNELPSDYWKEFRPIYLCKTYSIHVKKIMIDTCWNVNFFSINLIKNYFSFIYENECIGYVSMPIKVGKKIINNFFHVFQEKFPYSYYLVDLRFISLK